MKKVTLFIIITSLFALSGYSQVYIPIHTSNISDFSSWSYTNTDQIVNDIPQGDAVALYSGGVGYMISPALNLSTCSAIPYIVFKFRRRASTTLATRVTVQISTTGSGGPWSNLGTYQAVTSGWYNTTQLSLNAYKSYSSVHIRLIATGTTSPTRYSIVDDVHIYCATPPSNDNCSGAISLTVSPPGTCNTTSGTMNYASQSVAGCSRVANNDVWYSFVATATTHLIEVVGNPEIDPVIQLYSGSCASLTSIQCQDATSTEKESLLRSGLTIGNTYYVRVYDYWNRVLNDGTFTICVAQPLVNDECAGAISLTVGAPGICSPTNGTISSATTSPSIPPCGSGYETPNNDVWYSFVATNSQQVISVFPSTSMDAVVQLFSGSCGSPISMQCRDATQYGSTETIDYTGFIVGNTYYIRVYDYYTNPPADGAFNICVYEYSLTTSNCSNATPISCGTTLSGETNLLRANNSSWWDCHYTSGPILHH